MNQTYPMEIIEFMREHYYSYNGICKDIGWYMCVPMNVIAKQLGMTVDELGEQTWNWKYQQEMQSQLKKSYDDDRSEDDGHWKPSPFN